MYEVLVYIVLQQKKNTGRGIDRKEKRLRKNEKKEKKKNSFDETFYLPIVDNFKASFYILGHNDHNLNSKWKT